MIPKIIHYCWFGKNPLPKLIQDCIASWEFFLPEYQIIRWSEENYKIEHPFAVAAFEDKSWAFLVDYVRFDILNKYGGIYLDTDMLVLKPLDIFLKDECFLGYEDDVTISCGIIGTVKKHTFIQQCLSLYDKITYNKQLPPVTSLLTALYKRTQPKNVSIYSEKTFYPMPFIHNDFNSYKKYITKDSYAIHLWAGSWLNEWQLFQNGLKKAALNKIIKKLKTTPIQPFKFYTKVVVTLLPKKLKYFLKFMMKKLILLGLSTPIINELIINSNISYSYRYYNFPTENSFKDNTIKNVKRQGINYQINIGEHNGLRIYYNIFSRSTWELFNLIQPHFNVIDVGANIGFYTLNFAKKARKGCVYSFEPFPHNYKLLGKNISLNNFNNISTFPIALGEIEKKVEMNNLEDRNLGMVHIVPHSKNELNNSIEVNTLDYFFIEKTFKIDLIKIDIEGYEMNFIHGAINILTKDYPILFVEVIDKHLKKYNSSAYELVKKLEDLGYNHIVNAETGQLIYSVFDLDNCFLDIICKKDE